MACCARHHPVDDPHTVVYNSVYKQVDEQCRVQLVSEQGRAIMGAASKQRIVRVTEATHRALRELSMQRGESTATILEQAVERFQREQLLNEANAAWAAILADPTAAAEVAAEQALWDQTLADGLADEEW